MCHLRPPRRSRPTPPGRAACPIAPLRNVETTLRIAAGLLRGIREQCFQLRESEDVFGSARCALEPDQGGKVHAQARAAKQVERDRVRKERLEGSAAGSFAEEIERSEISVEREVEASLDRRGVEPERKTGRHSAEIRTVRRERCRKP